MVIKLADMCLMHFLGVF